MSYCLYHNIEADRRWRVKSVSFEDSVSGTDEDEVIGVRDGDQEDRRDRFRPIPPPRRSSLPYFRRGGSPPPQLCMSKSVEYEVEDDQIIATEEVPEMAEACQLVEVLKRKLAFLSGGRDKCGAPLLSVCIPEQSGELDYDDLRTSISYLITLVSENTRSLGFVVIVDARRCSVGRLRKTLLAIQADVPPYLDDVYVVKGRNLSRREIFDLKKEQVVLGFKAHYVSLEKLHKIVHPSQLTSEFGGSFFYNHSHWIETKHVVEKYVKDTTNLLKFAESQYHLLRSEVEEMADGNTEELLARVRRTYQDIAALHETALNKGQVILKQMDIDPESGFRYIGGNGHADDVKACKTRVMIKRGLVRNQQLRFEELWESSKERLRHLGFLAEVEKEVHAITDWILESGDGLLRLQRDIGDSLSSVEYLRQQHEMLELQCAEPYSRYSQLLHRIEDMIDQLDPKLRGRLEAQRDYLNSICRAFANRLERKRNLLLASSRFHRLAEEVFQKGKAIRNNADVEITNFAEFDETQKQLQYQQKDITHLCEEASAEGCHLLGTLHGPPQSKAQDVPGAYAKERIHVQDLLASIEREKRRCMACLEVRQKKMGYIKQLLKCESDARQSTIWLEDLCDVMVTLHSQVGKSVSEADVYYREQKQLEKTAEEAYEYGRDFLETALSLRKQCGYNVNIHAERAHRMVTAWRRFLQGIEERTNRLILCRKFHLRMSKVMDRFDRLEKTVQTDFRTYGTTRYRWITRRHRSAFKKIMVELAKAVVIGKQLMEKIKYPLIEGYKTDKYQPDEGAVDSVQRKIAAAEKRAREFGTTYYAEIQRNASSTSCSHDSASSKYADAKDEPSVCSTIDDWWSCASNGTISAEDWRSVADDSTTIEEWRSCDDTLSEASSRRSSLSHDLNMARPKKYPKEIPRPIPTGANNAGSVDESVALRPQVANGNRGWQEPMMGTRSQAGNQAWEEVSKTTEVKRMHFAQEATEMTTTVRFTHQKMFQEFKVPSMTGDSVGFAPTGGVFAEFWPKGSKEQESEPMAPVSGKTRALKMTPHESTTVSIPKQSTMSQTYQEIRYGPVTTKTKTLALSPNGVETTQSVVTSAVKNVPRREDTSAAPTHEEILQKMKEVSEPYWPHDSIFFP